VQLAEELQAEAFDRSGGSGIPLPEAAAEMEPSQLAETLFTSIMEE
jgi:hypothetical protein